MLDVPHDVVLEEAEKVVKWACSPKQAWDTSCIGWCLSTDKVLVVLRKGVCFIHKIDCFLLRKLAIIDPLSVGSGPVFKTPK